MKSATIKQLKDELNRLEKDEVVKLTLRLARSRKDAKELLTYLLFESHDEHQYVETIKQEISEEFAEINPASVYYAKKSVMRIHRKLGKQIRYSGEKATKVELLMHFCECLAKARFRFTHSRVLTNLYVRQLKAIDTAMKGLHEDLQYDYKDRRSQLSVYLGAGAG